MKKKLSLLMVALVAIAAFAVQQTRRAAGDPETVEFDFTSQDFVANTLGITIPKANSSTYISSPISYSGIKITTFKSTNFPAIFLNQAGTELSFRIYKISGENKGAIEFSGVNEGTTFSKIVMTGDTKLAQLVADKGTITMASDNKTLTWEGDDVTSVKFTNDNSSNTVRINTISVTKIEAAAPAVAAPTISGETPFIGSTTVTLACDTEGAQIYYTTDGGDPTASDALYAGPFQITATTTVKAVAAKGDDMSAVVSKEFVAIPTVANIAALNELENNATFAFTGEALVVYQNGKYNYVKDNTGSSLIYGTSVVPADAVGKTIAANWTGKVSIYKNLFEAIPDAALTLKDGEAVVVTYPAVAIDDVKAENVNQVVTLKGVTYTKPDGKNFNITKDGNEMVVAGYNQFGLEIADPVEGETYDIVGVISRYNDNIQFQPISITRVPKVCPVTVEAADITDGDITAALAAKTTAITEAGDKVGDITINLAENGAYTVSAPIEASASIAINGAAGAVIDASANAGSFILMSKTPSVEAVTSGQYVVKTPSKIDGVKITGLTNAIYADNGTGYAFESFTINNCVFQYSTQKNVALNFASSMAINFNITNSTFYCNEAGSANFIALSGKRPWQITGYEEETGKLTVANCTFYNVAKAKQFLNTNTLKGQKYLYVMNSNIFVNVSNKKIYGNMTNNKNQLTTDGKNTYMFDGAFFAEPNYNGDEGLQTDPGFKDAANGDFAIASASAQAKAEGGQTGDARWGTYDAGFAVKVVNAEGITITPEVAYAAEGEKVYATYTLSDGYQLDKPEFVDDNGDEIAFAEGQIGLEEVGGVEKMFIIMPAKNVTIIAKASKKYQIALNLSQENGNATCLSVNKEKPETAFKKEGDKIYLAINPDAGYEAVISVKAGEDDVEVTAEAGTYDEQQYTHFFTMPASAVTVTVIFKSATGINSIAADKMKNATIYNMKGQRVDKAQKGLYIVNGKKVVIK